MGIKQTLSNPARESVNGTSFHKEIKSIYIKAPMFTPLDWLFHFNIFTLKKIITAVQKTVRKDVQQSVHYNRKYQELY